ncbi:DUF998 domain-containing protein [Kribbella qitaiheensis]|uniref:DUF998 domain-containing protein n=1 Tax=Kribbella qitaiheensis TaxID=1544730 RepID=UPI00361C241D
MSDTQQRVRGLFGLELKTVDREAAGADDYFVRSYLAMRLRIGLVAFFLPWVLILIDWKLIDSQLQIRGSMSAYYHSPARDVFVGGLFVTGAFLVSYLRAKRKTYDYWLSTFAGWALIIVALVPTGRALNAPGFKVGSKSCADFPGPPDCNGFQEVLHENTAKLVHGIAATIFVFLLAALCFVFALREFGYGPAARKLCKSDTTDVKSVWAELKHREISIWTYLWRGIRDPKEEAPPPKRRVPLYLAMGILILLAGAWAKFGVDLPLPLTEFRLGPTYVGEVVAFTAFGVAWMVSGKDLKPFGKVAEAVGGAIKAVTRSQGPAQKSGPA